MKSNLQHKNGHLLTILIFLFLSCKQKDNQDLAKQELNQVELELNHALSENDQLKHSIDSLQNKLIECNNRFSEKIENSTSINRDPYSAFIGMWCGEGFGCWRIQRSGSKFIVEYGIGDSDGSLSVTERYTGYESNGKIRYGNATIELGKQAGKNIIRVGQFKEVYYYFNK